jgi:hypothetical protein
MQELCSGLQLQNFTEKLFLSLLLLCHAETSECCLILICHLGSLLVKLF